MLVQRVQIAPDRPEVDVRVIDGVVTEVAEPGLSAQAREDVIDGAGGYLLPGFVDGHVHMTQWALARRRIDVGAAASAAQTVELVAAAGGTGVVQAQGFRAALWPDTPHKDMLERALPGAAVAITSMDLHAVWLSPAMMAALGVQHPTGVFRDHEAIAVSGAVDAWVNGDVQDGYVLEGTDQLAARGVTEILDFEYDDNWTSWCRRFAARRPSVRVTASTWAPWLGDAVLAGRRTGDEAPGTDAMLRMGPLKIMADGSLNTRTACCHDAYPDADADEESHGLLLVDFGELVALISQAASAGVSSAVHAIGDRANSVVLDAFEHVRGLAATGAVPAAGGRIEHAQQVRPEDLPRFARAGLVASVQPQHAMSDRDVADVLWSRRRSIAYPYGSLLRHAATLQFGSDAPVSPPDPLASVADAVWRTDDDRPPWRADESMPLGSALRAASGGRGEITVGSAGDFVVLAESPYVLSNADLRAVPVTATVCAGRVTHRDDR